MTKNADIKIRKINREENRGKKRRIKRKRER